MDTATAPTGNTPPAKLIHRALCKALESVSAEVDDLIEHFPEFANELTSFSRQPSGFADDSSFSRQHSGLANELTSFSRQQSGLANELSCFSRQQSGATDASLCSLKRFAERNQTLIFIDWDDTLFPTTEFFQRLSLNSEGFGDESQLDDSFRTSLQAWREALLMFLHEALTLTSNCTIVTNAKRPWVQVCIDKFVPEIKHLFEEECLKVVYASERVRKSNKTKVKSQCMDWRAVKRHSASNGNTHLEQDEDQTAAKCQTMQDELVSFYSQFTGQSWKNILTVGDMPYERNTASEMSMKRNPPFKANLRTKTLVLPSAPSLTEITLSLRVSRLTLSACVEFDGDFNLNLTQVENPLERIAEALHMPQLAEVPFERRAWGRATLNQKEMEVAVALAKSSFEIE